MEDISTNNVEEGGWQPISEEQLCNMFGDYVLYEQEQFKNQLTLNDFNYEIFDFDYYAEKFPHFQPEIHELLANISKEKIIDLRKRNDFFKMINNADERPFAEDK